MTTVTLQQVLNPNVHTVPAATPLAEVWRRMETLRISCVVVLDERTPVGIFTERDSVALVARGGWQPGWQENEPISSYMHEPVIASNPGMDIHRAYQLMAARNVRHLLLVDGDGALLGLVSEGDLLHGIGMEHLVQPRTVASAMTGKVVTLNENDSLLAAARAMAERVLSCLVVVRAGRPVGMLSERDIVRLSRRGGDPEGLRLGAVMSQPLIAVQAEDLLAVAMHRMEQAGIRRLVVVDAAGGLVGLLTRHDVVKALQEHYVELLQATIERLEQDLNLTRDHLQTVEHRLMERSVMSQVNDAVFVVDLASGRVVEANEQAGDLLGYSQAELLERYCYGFAELCGGAENWPAWVAAFVQRGIQTEETRFRRKTGEWFPVELSLRHIRNDRDATHDYLVAVVRDISQRKHHEARIRLDREQQKALREILEIGIGDGSLRERLERCLDRLLAVSWLTLLPKGGIFVIEGGGLRLLAQRNFSPEIQASCARVALGQCLCGRAAETGATIYAECVDHRHEITYSGMTDHGHYSLPLAAAGEVLGVLVLYLPVGHPRLAEEQEFLEAVGDALAGVLRRDRVEQAVAAKEAEIHLLLDSTAEAIFGVDMDCRCTFVNRACLEMLGYGAPEDLLGKRIHEVIHYAHADGRPYPECDCPAMPGMSLREKRHVENEVFWRKDGTPLPVEYWSHPVVREGSLAGAVVTFIDISQRLVAEAQLEHLAHHDPLTTLPNRNLFQSRLAHAINVSQRHGTGLGLLFIDLDGFKNINDSLGHPAGDELLQAIARRLSDNLRTVDTLARLGGDEFVILLEDLDGPNEAAVVAQNLLALLRQPFHLSGGQEVFSGASIGISLFPDDAVDATQLVRNADAALYQAKSQGRDTYRFYTEALTRVANERMQLESRLRGALERGEFVVYYQPQVATRDGRLLGAEALVRWQTPEGELVPPARFIPLAEETGLIRPLGEWILREACAWFRAGFDAGLAPLRLSVNLSSRQFEQRDLVERLHTVLEETGFPAHLLELEITESAIMAQGNQAPAALAALKGLGVGLAIDDFGTGYSSLAYLKRFPVDKLKIDRSFMQDIPQDINDVEIAATIIAMAKNLKLKVLAEGVETEEQLAFLQIHDCDAYQGYFYSRPLPAKAFLELWRRRQA
ncbi:MAG: EAL domain-containing protein [Pseudomonadota bacterium]|nr:EAL domain-containing protein [Pseudomonadota bacterium]